MIETATGVPGESPSSAAAVGVKPPTFSPIGRTRLPILENPPSASSPSPTFRKKLSSQAAARTLVAEVGPLAHRRGRAERVSTDVAR